MTLAQVQAVRDKYYNALLALDLNMLNHSIDEASYDFDSHRDSLQRAFTYWDNLYNRKSSGGRTRRLDRKSV
jgi:hypothetical protein